MRYLLFGFDDYFPAGGMGDCKGKFEQIEDARLAASMLDFKYIELYDSGTGDMYLLTRHAAWEKRGK